jgi:hypothetical protein
MFVKEFSHLVALNSNGDALLLIGVLFGGRGGEAEVGQEAAASAPSPSSTSGQQLRPQLLNLPREGPT